MKYIYVCLASLASQLAKTSDGGEQGTGEGGMVLAMGPASHWGIGTCQLNKKEWLPAPVFLPGEFHGLRSLEGYSPTP